MNFYPFHIGDYISHTNHLTNDEDLTYRRMIDLYYMMENAFFDDFEWIARRVKSTEFIVAIILNEFFELQKDGLWHNSRADKEIAKYQYLQESGKKGAEKRWGNRDNKPTQCLPNSLPITNPLATKTKNQEPIPLKNITPIGFDLFWNSYNKKVGKPNSLKVWVKINPDEELLKLIVQKALADAKAKPDSKFRKDPERWLKGQHWLDEVVIQQEEKTKYLPLGTDAQIEAAYRAECGDPANSRFQSYFEMRNFIVAQREKRKAA
jgi:uncharacterized protein YdaU (DUF1376 family)